MLTATNLVSAGNLINPIYHVSPPQSFLIRKQYFNHSETGYFKAQKRNAPNPLNAMGGRRRLGRG